MLSLVGIEPLAQDSKSNIGLNVKACYELSEDNLCIAVVIEQL